MFAIPHNTRKTGKRSVPRKALCISLLRTRASITSLSPPMMNSKDTVTAPKNCKSLVKNAELGKISYLNAPHQTLLSEEFTAKVTKALVWKKACKPTGSFFKDRIFWVPLGINWLLAPKMFTPQEMIKLIHHILPQTAFGKATFGQQEPTNRTFVSNYFWHLLIFLTLRKRPLIF